jgi:hypothetical protein
MTILQDEALKERARRLYTIPTEIDTATYGRLSPSCQAFYDGPTDGTYRLNHSIYALSPTEKFDLLQGLTAYNGIRMVLVSLDATTDQAFLDVHFYNRNSFSEMVTAGPTLFPISGGYRVIAGPATGQIQTTAVDDPDAEQAILRLTIEPIGDYSTYTLSINTQSHPTLQIDPLFGEIDFKFRPGCFTIDCAPEWDPAPAPKDNPTIDYLAKDYESFKHTLIAAMMQRVPGWQPSSEADLDQVLLELFCVAADELSDYQDRVMNEAYLLSARKRVSLARHARLMDYHIHQGNQASTWLALKLASTPAAILELPKPHPRLSDEVLQLRVWAGSQEPEHPAAVVFMTRENPAPLFRAAIGFSTDLDGGACPTGLQDQFAANDIFLSSNVSITVQATGRLWLLFDRDNFETYQIVARDGSDPRLDIYIPHLHHLLNQLGLYTWEGAIPALAAGCTSADLQVLEIDSTSSSGYRPLDDEAVVKTVQHLIRAGAVQSLLIQEWLNPATGQVAGRNPEKRQLLKLLPNAEALQDPVAGAWFVRVHWEPQDALKAHYCFTIDCPEGQREQVSLLHGNLVPVFHGRPALVDDEYQLPMPVVFKDPAETLAAANEFHYEQTEKWGTLCRLPIGPLAYTATPVGGEMPPRSTLAVNVDGDTWDEVISLVHSDASAKGGDHFVVETDEEGRSLIRFGNGTNGQKLAEGAEVHCTYQVGWGLDGNIGADQLRYFDATHYSEIAECWNPFDVTNGRGPEPVAEIVRRAPEAYRFRQLRAITLRDYEDRAAELPEVARAAARYGWTGSWRTVQIAIDPVGRTDLPNELRQQVARHLEAVRLIGEDLEIREPRYVPLEIMVQLCIHPHYWPEDVRFLLEQEFSEGYTPDGRLAFFHPDRWTFGQLLRASEIIGRIHLIEGVEHVLSVTMKRWNASSSEGLDIVAVRVNEIIRVRNDPDHMEDGFITFDPLGGRQ